MQMGVSSQGAVYGGQEGPPRPAPAQSALPADFLSLGGPASPGEIVDAQAQADEELARRLQQQETMRALHDARYAVHNGSRHGPERRSGPPERRGSGYCTSFFWYLVRWHIPSRPAVCGNDESGDIVVLCSQENHPHIVLPPAIFLKSSLNRTRRRTTSSRKWVEVSKISSLARRTKTLMPQ